MLKPDKHDEFDIIGDVSEDLKQLAENSCRTPGMLFRYFKTREQRNEFYAIKSS